VKTDSTHISLFGIKATFQKWLLYLALFTTVIYINSLGNGYNMDDTLVTVQHVKTSRGLEAIPEIWTSPYFEDAAGNHYGYRPTVLTSFAIEHALFGESSFVSHLINLLLYIALVLAVVGLLRSLLPYQLRIILIAGFLFAALPIHVEAVASIKNRDEILAMLFAALAALSFDQLIKTNHWKQLLLIGIFATLSVTAKKSAIPIVLVYPLLLLIRTLPYKFTVLQWVGFIIWVMPTAFFALDFAVLNTILTTLTLSTLLIIYLYFGAVIFTHLKKYRVYYFLSFVVVAVILFTTFGSSPSSQIPVPAPGSTSALVGSGLKEGRALTYVENPVVGHYDWERRIALGVFSLYKYAQLTLIPVGLSFYYGFSVIEPLTFYSGTFWVSFLVLSAILSLLLWRKTKSEILFIALFWYGSFMLLFSNVFVLVAGGIGDRLALAASVGLALFLAFFLEKVAFKFKYAIFIVIVLFGIMSIQRNSLWADEYTLMTHDLQHLSGSAQANNLAGIACMKKYSEQAELTMEEKQSLLNEAEQNFKNAIKVYPYLFNTNFDLGRVYLEKANYSKAERYFDLALQMEPQNELGMEERLRAAYLSKHYRNVLSYLKDIKQDAYSELIVEIAAHTNLLVENRAQARIYCKKGLAQYPSNNNFKLIWSELNLK
jgi:hypothetical protein